MDNCELSRVFGLKNALLRGVYSTNTARIQHRYSIQNICFVLILDSNRAVPMRGGSNILAYYMMVLCSSVSHVILTLQRSQTVNSSSTYHQRRCLFAFSTQRSDILPDCGNESSGQRQLYAGADKHGMRAERRKCKEMLRKGICISGRNERILFRRSDKNVKLRE